jgi:hypothetical protein
MRRAFDVEGGLPMVMFRTRRLSVAVGLALSLAAGSAAAGDKEPASLLDTPEALAAALHARFGPDARILRLGVRGDGADVEVQDRSNTAHVNRYAFEDGAIGEPEPVQVGRNQRQVEARLFRLADVDLAILPRVVADARQRADTAEARVLQVAIERMEGFGDTASWGRPLVRVIVEGPRGGALVEYGLDGKHRKTHRW